MPASRCHCCQRGPTTCTGAENAVKQLEERLKSLVEDEKKEGEGEKADSTFSIPSTDEDEEVEEDALLTQKRGCGRSMKRP
jgi:hypothetical protein